METLTRHPPRRVRLASVASGLGCLLLLAAGWMLASLQPDLPLVGLGSVCRRQPTAEIALSSPLLPGWESG